MGTVGAYDHWWGAHPAPNRRKQPKWFWFASGRRNGLPHLPASLGALGTRLGENPFVQSMAEQRSGECGHRSSLLNVRQNVASFSESTPSMRRPVRVKSVFLLPVGSWFSSWAASVAIPPSALFVERISLGASWASSFQQVLLPDNRP